MYKQITIYDLLDILHDKLGEQNWWPARNAEEMLSGMILIQNTNSKSVAKSLDNLNQVTQFNVDKMLQIPELKLQELIQPSGFFKNKAIYLRSLLTAYRDKFSDWEKLPTNLLRKNLLALKGVGNETADVLLLYYFHRPTFVSDNYAMKLFTQLHSFTDHPSYMQLKKAVQKDFDFTSKQAEELHALIDEFGKLKSDFFKDYQLLLPIF
ncbi:endonuclease III domain-containing protein [Companilactobacillus halodurans]|uniref:Endonuclease III n=1 Tax=Companilactobacillus halodurans TaxID=2584183 RepID=A0A5P0ZWB8_9LACO|nr:endonuclease III [Companilactobacillus halodurans]MQS75456.1 endonuclease III [Companilactobacillus halodurans]MQS97300.1 endonuclease III [Companilactobacillus halodurans]